MDSTYPIEEFLQERQRKASACSSAEHPLPRLSSASSESIEITKEYQSGATYVGCVRGNKKAGKGTFQWPNGAKYEGEFVSNKRHGRGTQVWPDGSSYCGSFSEDARHGHGTHQWANGESYEGIFYKDRRHGTGKYSWPDGSSYSGTFFIDHPEGYGTFCFTDGRKFQGLYKQGEREGPGVMTYPDGKQDVGLWHRDHLIKLCTAIDGAFTMKDHSEFDYYPEEHQIYIKPESMANKIEIIEDIINPPEEFDYEPKSCLSASRASSVTFHSGLHAESLAADVDSFNAELKSKSDVNMKQRASSPVTETTQQLSEKCPGSTASQHPSEKRPSSSEDQRPLEKRPGSAASQQASEKRPNSAASQLSDSPSRPTSGKSKISSAKSKRSRSARSAKTPKSVMLEVAEEESGIVAWNNTRSCVEMQKHIMKHSVNQGRAGFSVDVVLSGSREGFAEKGPGELAAEQLITAATAGRTQEVADLVHAGKVAVDVSDCAGHTALLGAAVNWHQDTINCLLDGGADINKLNDEGVSALAACHIFFYPVDCFRYNIAERYLEKPPETTQEVTNDTNESLRGILMKSKGKTPHPPPPAEKKNSSVDSKKIGRLRELYRGQRDEDDKENVGMSDDSYTRGRGSEGPSHEGQVEEERKLGTLKVKRSVRINIEEMMAPGPEPPTTPPKSHRKRPHRFTDDDDDDDFDSMSDVTTEVGDFESVHSFRNYGIEVSDLLIERCATGLSTNEMVVGRQRSAGADHRTIGTARRLAMDKAHHQLMESTIRLLLRRGASPNASSVPMPVLFSAIKAADVDAVKLLLLNGASTSSKLSEKKGGLGPLHIAVAIPGEAGVEITKLLLDALADPDARATEDDSFLNTNLQEEWTKDAIDPASAAILGGRTPLHIACARDDNYKHAWNIVHLLLDHHGNPNLLCNGHSPLALAVRSGNDLAIDELLRYHADPCLPLTHGVGSALCIASSTEYEHKRTPDGRIQLIDKLISAGADILAPIPIGPKRVMGTAVDYAYYMYNLDRRIAHMPYHALTPAERETFNARRRLLGHVGDIMRVKATEKEKQRLEEDERNGRQSRSPSPNFVYTGAGASVQSGRMRGRRADSKVSKDSDTRKPLLRYCYECGRSVGVRLSVCTRCKEVYYCSKACKLKAWNARHKEECVRVGGRSPSNSKGDKRIDSPTPATDPDRGKPHTVKGINKGDPRIKVPFKGRSSSAGKLAVKGPLTITLENGKIIHVDNYSYV